MRADKFKRHAKWIERAGQEAYAAAEAKAKAERDAITGGLSVEGYLEKLRRESLAVLMEIRIEICSGGRHESP